MAKKRYIKIPIDVCKPIIELTKNEHIIYTGFYEQNIKGIDYLIDIVQTSINNYYVRLTDISDGKYEDVDFYKFKEENSEPTLFSFFDI